MTDLDWGLLADPEYALQHYRAEQLADAAKAGLGLVPEEQPAGPEEYSSDFDAFVQRRNPTLRRFEHIPKLINVADRIVTGALKRVIVIMPPRYFKTEIFSRLLTAHFLRTYPEQHAGLISWGAPLAWAISEEARTYFQQDGGFVSQTTAAKRHWRTMHGGSVWAHGAGQGIIGFGYHLGIVDDPVDPMKAISPSFLRMWNNWWPGKFLSRQEPGARIVFVMQRLGQSDPINYLFRREVGEDVEAAPENWHVVIADEIKSDEPLGRWDGPMGLPPTCTVEPDERELGTVLAPSRFTPEQVTRAHSTAGPIVASTQRQGRPMAPRGDFWRDGWFRSYEELPAHAYNGGKDWDLAYTKEDRNAASAFIESYRGPGSRSNPKDFPIYIEDVDWEWLEFPELISWMTERGGPHYVEEKASGKSAVQVLRANGVAATEVPVKGDKLQRASAVQPIVSAKRVWVNKRVADHLLRGDKQGLLRVTAEGLAGIYSQYLDVNDTFVQAIYRHANIGAKGRGGVVR